jgi:NAD(P)H-hydrate epimerase
MEILTGEQMRSVDRRAIDGLGIPGLELMEAAGRGVAEALLRDEPSAATNGVVILCGTGNNGGDGLVAARRLAARGVPLRVLLFGRADAVTGDAALNLRAARAAGIAVEEVPDGPAWDLAKPAVPGRGVVLDALLGTGVRGGARGVVAAAIAHLASSRARVFSVDLPSGVNADTGAIEGPAVRAERTYTLCRPKVALVLEPAAALAGLWSVIPIGIPDHAVAAEGSPFEWLDADAVRPLLPPRPRDAHKGTYGHLLVVAGSLGKAGAAVLAARGALRAGVGLVTAAVPRSSLATVAAAQAEVMTEALPETRAGCLARSASTRILALLRARDALAIGPGLGIAPDTRTALAAVLARRPGSAVLDADGLNAFAPPGRKSLRLVAGEHPLVLTPHPGEAGRLLGTSAAAVQADRPGSARALAEATGAVVVLKGQATVVASPGGALCFNASGNPGMATAGTGDVLTGVIGALLARGLPARDAARLAVFLHGDAGDRAAKARGQEGMIASDLLEELPAAAAALTRGGA